MPRNRKGPSLGDVARLAGVSPQTVSRVSTGSQLVASDTESRVRKAMNQLGYVPNHAARALRQGSYKALGVVTQQLEQTGEALPTAAIVDEAAAAGYTVTVVQIRESDPEKFDAAFSRLARLPIDGLLVISIGTASIDQVKLPDRLPTVAIDGRLAYLYPTVFSNPTQGIEELMEYLISLGHRNIHQVVGALDTAAGPLRRDIFRKLMKDNRLPEGKEWQGDWSMSSGYRAGQQIAKDPHVTAVFCGNDEMAIGVMSALNEAGLRVPQDVSVTGFDGTQISEFANPPLTTVLQDFTTVPRLATQELIREIEEHVDPPLEPRLVSVTTIIRQSTAPPNPARQ